MMISEVNVTLWVAFTAGTLSFLSPCVLPLFPSYLVYITGFSFNDLQKAKASRLPTLLHSLFFVLGFSLIFILLGAVAGMASGFREVTMTWMGIIERLAGVVILLFGLHMIGLFKLSWLLAEKRVDIANKPTGYLGTVLVGSAFAAGWTPCIGPILGSILTLVASTSTGGATEGMLQLGVYSLGLGIPFVASALLFDRFLLLFQRFKKYLRFFELSSGLLMAVVGIFLIVGEFGQVGMFITKCVSWCSDLIA